MANQPQRHDGTAIQPDGIANRDGESEQLYDTLVGTLGFGEGGVNVSASQMRYIADCGLLHAEDLNVTADVPAICSDADTRHVVAFVDSDPESINDVNDQLPYELDLVATNRTAVFDQEGGGKCPPVMLGMIDDPREFEALLREQITTEDGRAPDVLNINAGVTGANGAAGLMMIPELLERERLFPDQEHPETYATAILPLGYTEDIDILGLRDGPAADDTWRSALQTDYVDAEIEGAYGNVPFVLERAQKAVEDRHYDALFPMANSHLLAMQAVNANPVNVRTIQDMVSDHRRDPVYDPYSELYDELGVPHDSIPAACNEMVQTVKLPQLINRGRISDASLSRDMGNNWDGAEFRAAIQQEVIAGGFFGVDDVTDLAAYYPRSEIPDDLASQSNREVALTSVAKIASLLLSTPHTADAVSKFEFVLHMRGAELDGTDWRNVPANLSRALPGSPESLTIRAHSIDGLDSEFPVGQKDVAAWAYASLDDCVEPYRQRLQDLRNGVGRRRLQRGL